MSKENKAVLGVCGLLVAIMVGAWLWPSSDKTPKYEYGKAYTFQYSLLSTATAKDGRIAETRLFIFEKDGVTFSSPVESFGRRITVLDRTLPPNTFKVVKRVVPPLAIGERTFDPGSTFDQVRFNMRTMERQAVVPRVTSQNRPPSAGKS